MVGQTLKHNFYEFSSNVPECYERLIEDVKEFPFWAYIKHTPDDDDNRVHYHFIIRCSPMTLDSISRKLDLPSNFIRWVRVRRSFIRYLVHYDNPEKEQYKREEIITNNRQFIDLQFSDSSTCSPLDEYASYCDVLKGNITPEDYLTSNSMLISSLSFSSRLNVYNSLFSASRNNNYLRSIDKIK